MDKSLYINNWNITNAGGALWRTVWGYHAMTPQSTWPVGAYSPVLVGDYLGMKPLDLVILVRGANREAIRVNVGEILRRLDGVVTLRLPEFSHLFRGTLKTFTTNEDSRQRFHTLTVHMEGYEYDATAISGEVQDPVNNTLTLANPGNLESPGVVKVWNTTGNIKSLYIQVNTTRYYVKMLEAKATITINGETGAISTPAAFDVWQIPMIQPGNNAIKIVNTMFLTSDDIHLSVSFHPRYR